MRNLLGIKNINCHSELDSESINANQTLSRISKFTAFIKKFNPLTKREGSVGGKCIITPPEFLSSQSSLRNSTLPVQGGRKFAKAGFTLAGATHVGLPPIIAKAGFTLAEVLITLGIIGVVAAMTIPGLITSYQKHVAVVQLKKIYSQLSQVFLEISEDPGYDVFDGQPQVFVKDHILPRYNGATYYPPTANHMQAMCYDPNDYYFGSADSVEAQYASINPNTGASSSHIATPFYPRMTASIKLMDGACIGFNKLINPVVHPGVTIFVDINGSHVKPNRLGRDLFWFYMDQETYAIKPSTREGNFKLEEWKVGAKKIMDDGWKINKDYPWK